MDDPVGSVDKIGLKNTDIAEKEDASAEKGTTRKKEIYRFLCDNYSFLFCDRNHSKVKGIEKALAKELEAWGKGMLLHRYTIDHPVYNAAEALFPEIGPNHIPKKD